MKLVADDSIDLHLHTLYSDGVWTPEQLIDYLLQEGFALAAITDHDRLDKITELQQLARAKGFPLLPAVEMTTHWRDEPWVDVLCYGFDLQPGPLHALADTLLRQQQDNIRETVQAMAQAGHPLPDDAVQKIIEEPLVQQPHSLVALTKEQDYELLWLKDAGLKQLTNAIGPVVEATHEMGGVCLLAHPGRVDGYAYFDESVFDQLREEVPIDGIEVYYSKHSAEKTAMFKAYAEKHDLLITAGSDSHKPDKPPIKYRADSIHKLLERLDIHVQ